MTLQKICALGAGMLCLMHGAARADHDLAITVYPSGYIGSTMTAPNMFAAQSIMHRIPGNNSVVPAKNFETLHAVNFKDMLATIPGVEAQPRYGEEVRLSIRGSGLSRGFHLRGITVLQDGVPINLADGSGDFQEIDPLLANFIEVYRGGNALRYGVATLGGAVNVISPNGATEPGTTLRAEGGSFGTLRLHAAHGEQFDQGDAYAAVTRSMTQGFRDQSDESKLRFSGNAAWRPNDAVESRFYAAWNDLEQEVPGTLSLYNATHNPRTAPAINLVNDYARNIRSLRLSNKTAFDIGGGDKIVSGIYFNDKALYHPIFQVVDQNSRDVGGFLRLEGKDSTVGLNLSTGHIDAKRFVNVGGRRGALTAQGNQDSDNIEIYGEQRIPLGDHLSLIGGVQGLIAWRDYEDRLAPANNAAQVYYAVNPKVGLLYEPRPEMQFFANVSRSAEPPTFSELVQAPVTGFVPLEDQKAWTAEAGTRWRHERMSVEATVYRSWIRDELLQYTTGVGIPAATFNAGRTIHQGVELGVAAQVNARVRGQLTYTYNDFFFDNDPQYRNNTLAGAAPHNIRAALRYEDPDGWFVEPSVEWVPQGARVDYANTMKSNDYAVVNVNGGVDVGHGVSVFVDGRNLLDKKYAATFSTITNAQTANTDVFYPGDGRALYAGIKVRF